MTAWRLLKRRYINFYELHGFPASWQQWSGLGQMTGGSMQECNCMVPSPGPGSCYPQASPEVTQLFYLDSLWGLCFWSASVNYFFSLVTGMGRKYMPDDSSLQIALSFSDLLLVLTISCCCWHYLDSLIHKFEPYWFSKACTCSLTIYSHWMCKICSKFLFFVFGTEDSSISETVN